MKRKYVLRIILSKTFKTSMLQINSFCNILRRTLARLSFKGTCVSKKGLSQLTMGWQNFCDSQTDHVTLEQLSHLFFRHLPVLSYKK